MPRPKSFNPDTVLTKAMDVFWEKGYDAASISDLTEAMGINRFSLYDTFGDKHTLYLQALDAYAQCVVKPMIARIDEIHTLDDLESFFHALIDAQANSECSSCCFINKAAVHLKTLDDDAKGKIINVRDQVHKALVHSLERAKSAGQLSPEIDTIDAAWIFKIILAGFSTMSSTPIEPDSAKSTVTTLVNQFRA